MSKGIIEQDATKRKDLPICTGVIDYFPAALAALATHSKQGNDKHNPGEPMHWARDKSTDHADCLMRHVIERGGFDEDGNRHSVALAWRALALLQTELEEAGLVDQPVTPRVTPTDTLQFEAMTPAAPFFPHPAFLSTSLEVPYWNTATEAFDAADILRVDVSEDVQSSREYRGYFFLLVAHRFMKAYRARFPGHYVPRAEDAEASR